MEVPKSLASWKCWWHGTSAVEDMVKCMTEHVDPSCIPKGCVFVELKDNKKVCQLDFEDPHMSKVAEALCKSHPIDKEPSGYFLGDVVLALDERLAHCILGPPKPNPACERARRDVALKEGVKLKLMFSYLRHSSGRTGKGRKPEITFLKEILLQQPRPKRSQTGGSQASCSTPTPSPSGAMSVSESSSWTPEQEFLGAICIYLLSAC